MLEAGVLTEDDQLELLEGEIVAMSPIKPRHAGVVARLNQLLNNMLGQQAIVNPQNPVQLGEYSEPQPDIALLTSRDDFYTASHPTPKDVLLLIEVSDTSLEFDRDTKGELYAKAGISEYWIVNLLDNRVEVYREPSDIGYRTTRRILPGERLTMLEFPEISIAVEDILG